MEINIQVASDTDIVAARQEAGRLAKGLGFLPTDLSLIGSAVSELARNVLAKGGGQITFTDADEGRTGILIVARDKDGVQPAENAHRTSGDSGLRAFRQVMDEVQIVSHPAQGRTVIARKWLRPRLP